MTLGVCIVLPEIDREREHEGIDKVDKTTPSSESGPALDFPLELSRPLCNLFCPLIITTTPLGNKINLTRRVSTKIVKK